MFTKVDIKLDNNESTRYLYNKVTTQLYPGEPEYWCIDLFDSLGFVTVRVTHSLVRIYSTLEKGHRICESAISK